MPRKGHIPKRDVLPDPVYNSKIITKLINGVMQEGKRGVAQNILYNAFDIIKEKTGKDPYEVFKAALENIKPQMEVKTRRVGGANLQVPIEVRAERQQTLALRWLIQYARLRGEHSMQEKLASEIIDAANGIGNSVKKREDTHRMAEANKAFASYKW